jgi:putative hydrolase of the HAD superfamily
MNEVLIFDGDDTLWPCNSVFEDVLTSWIDWIDPDRARHDDLRRLVHDVDARRIGEHRSYGTTGFVTALQTSLTHALAHPPSPADLRHVETLAAPLRHRTATPLPTVQNTLSALAEQHPLILLTRGDPTEQNLLLDSSGCRRTDPMCRVRYG